MSDENDSNPKPPTEEEQEAAFRDLATMSVQVWNETLKACTRRITEVEKRLLAAEAEIIVLKKIIAGGLPPMKGRTDA